MHRSPNRIRQNSPASKNSKIWQIWYRYFRFDNSVLIEMKVIRNDISNNLYLDDKLPILYSSTSGSLQSWPNSQIWWFLNLIQLFLIARYRVLVEIKVVRNYVINHFELCDQLSRKRSFHSKSLKLAKFTHFIEKIVFWSIL